VVGESQVWISAESYGTYSLNMEDFWYDQEGIERRRGEWSKVGDWVLPFEGRAVYALELRLFRKRRQHSLRGGPAARSCPTADGERRVGGI
jgi:hypothetical protein